MVQHGLMMVCHRHHTADFLNLHIHMSLFQTFKFARSSLSELIVHILHSYAGFNSSSFREVNLAERVTMRASMVLIFSLLGIFSLLFLVSSNHFLFFSWIPNELDLELSDFCYLVVYEGARQNMLIESVDDPGEGFAPVGQDHQVKRLI